MTLLQRLGHKIQSCIPSIGDMFSFIAILILSSNPNFMGDSTCMVLAIVIIFGVNILPQCSLKSRLNSFIFHIIPPLLIVEIMRHKILRDDVMLNFVRISITYFFYNNLKKSSMELLCHVLNIVIYYLHNYSKIRILIFMISMVLLTFLKVCIVGVLATSIYKLADPPSGVLRVDHYHRKVSLKRDMDHGSYTHSTVYRYVNEDVRLQCYLPVRDLMTTQVKWTHNGQPLISGTYTKSYIEKRNHISFALLDITLLQDNEFGIYECWLEDGHNNNILLRRINLKLSVTYHHQIQSPIGSIIGMETYNWQILKSYEHVDITIQHEKRDPIAETFNLPFSGCSPLIVMHSTFIHCLFLAKAPCYDLPIALSYTDENMRKSKSTFCASFLSFGRYSVKIRRQIRNEETKETEFIEHEMPAFITLHPSYSFFYEEEFANYSFLQNTHSKEHSDYYDEDFLYAIIIYYARLYLEVTVVLSLPIKLCGDAWRLYIKYIVMPLKRMILVQKEETVNILVLNHDDDSEIVHKTIVKPLEKAGYIVCFQTRDWSEYGNLPEYKIMDKAASSNDKTILFLSQTLLNDVITVYKFLQCMVIARVQSGDVASKNVLLVTEGTCALPDDVGRSIPEVQTAKISTDNDKSERKRFSRILINWAKSCNYFQ